MMMMMMMMLMMMSISQLSQTHEDDNKAMDILASRTHEDQKARHTRHASDRRVEKMRFTITMNNDVSSPFFYMRFRMGLRSINALIRLNRDICEPMTIMLPRA